MPLPLGLPTYHAASSPHPLLIGSPHAPTSLPGLVLSYCFQSVGIVGGEEAASTDGVSDRAKGDLYAGTNAISVRRDHMRMQGVMHEGVIADWDAAEVGCLTVSLPAPDSGWPLLVGSEVTSWMVTLRHRVPFLYW